MSAHAFGYQPALGGHGSWRTVGRSTGPGVCFQWWYAYEAYAPDVFARGGADRGERRPARHSGRCDRLGLALALGAPGDDLWLGALGGAERDLSKAKLLGGDGVFLGRWKGAYLRHDGPEHVLAFAPTRSGKGVGLVVPTLLSWTGSAVIHDIKGENWQLTSGWRSTFSRLHPV